MENENENLETDESVELDANRFVNAINEVKRDMVDRSEYEKVVKENKQLINSLKNGEYLQNNEQAKEPIDLDKLRADIFSGKNNNLEYMEKLMLLRDELIAKGEKDPFLGNVSSPSEEDVRNAERVAEAFKQCIERAEGDSEIFTAELMRITADTKLNLK